MTQKYAKKFIFYTNTTKFQETCIKTQPSMINTLGLLHTIKILMKTKEETTLLTFA